MVDCIENLKSLATDDLIISIDKKGDLFGLAVLSYSQMNVWNSSYSLAVDNYLHFARRNSISFEEAIDEKPCGVLRGIVDNDYVIVGVLLVEDALNIELKSKIFGIVKGWDNNTEWELLGIVGKIVCLFQPGFFRAI